VSWNNKQAPRWASADDHWNYGPIYRSQLIENRIKADIASGHKVTIAQLVQSMDEPATEDIRAVILWPILKRAIGTPSDPTLRNALAELQTWVNAGGHRRASSLATAKHDDYTPAIELMDAWWPKLVQAEFGPMLGPRAMSAVEAMSGFGGTDFADGWWGYTSKDLRRVFGIGHERAPYSRAYCGNIPHRHLTAAALRTRCRTALRTSLRQALTVTPRQLYGRKCATDPEPACSDQNRWTYASAIALPPFPYQNRTTFQQVVTLTQHLAR
jgi:hypothetical protein